MSRNTLDPRKIRDMLALKNAGKSNRAIAKILGIDKTSVAKYWAKAQQADVSPAFFEERPSVSAVKALFFPEPAITDDAGTGIDFADIERSMKQKGATLKVLYEEWLEAADPDQYISYSRFCQLYRAFRKKTGLSATMSWRAGEAAFVDFAGKTMPITDPKTGERRPMQIFVAVLGASDYIYAEAIESQKIRDWIGAHVRMFEFFGGVPAIVVPDNLKAAVDKASYTDPVLNRAYEDLCEHYGTQGIAARAKHPRDKARVERAVGQITRQILFRLRDRTFHSLSELNQAIRERLHELNRTPFQRLPGSRFTAWLEIEKPALNPLPSLPYDYAEYKTFTVPPSYFLNIYGHFYMVPHRLRGERVECRITDRLVEVFHDFERVASYQRSNVIGKRSETPEFRHKNHVGLNDCDLESAARWASGIGPELAGAWSAMVDARSPFAAASLLNRLKKLEQSFTPERLEAACLRMNRSGTRKSTKILRGILNAGLDKFTDDIDQEQPAHPAHENIRGREYYAQIEEPVADDTQKIQEEVK